jgi:hypothetical protein
VISTAGRSTVFLQDPCPDAKFAIEKRYVIYKPLSFSADGKVVAGAWKQIVEEQGCGTSRLLNVMLASQNDGKLAAVALLPGTTHADPILQKDAGRYVQIALSTTPGGRETNCAMLYVADTQFLEEEGEALPGAKGRPWKELWTLQSCTQKMLVPMRFIPDSGRTSISAGPAGPGGAIQIIPLAR